MMQYSYGGRSPKEIIVDQRRQLFNSTEVEVEKRKHFEEAVSKQMVNPFTSFECAHCLYRNALPEWSCDPYSIVGFPYSVY